MGADHILALVIQTIVLVGGFFAYLQKRESTIREEHRRDMDKMQEKVERVDKENDEIKANYLHRFEELRESLYKTESNVVNEITKLRIAIEQMK